MSPASPITLNVLVAASKLAMPLIDTTPMSPRCHGSGSGGAVPPAAPLVVLARIVVSFFAAPGDERTNASGLRTI